MFMLAIALAAFTPSNGQVLAGRAFEALASRTDIACRSRRVRLITPADLDDAQQAFEDRLPRRTQARLLAVNTTDRRCAGRDGLSCATTATLEAFDDLGLMPGFVSYICSHPK